MENLIDQINGEVRLKEYLVRIGDLINIEGPLLSLFNDVRNEQLYLYDWVDSNSRANRFLIYAVSPQVVLDYLTKKITHKKLLSNAIGGRYYFADICPSELSAYKVFRLKQLPEGYGDTEANLFNQQFCIDMEKILLVAIRSRERDSNDFTYHAAEFVVDQEVILWENFSELGKQEEERFYNWAKLPLLDVSTATMSNGQIVRPIDARQIYSNTYKLKILDNVRSNNQLPKRKRLELYREQRSGIHPV